MNLISAIESFLLSQWDETENGLSEEDISTLAEGTLAFHLASLEQKEQIQSLFKILADNIENIVPEPARRKVFGRTLFGVQDALSIEAWVGQNATELASIKSNQEILELVWPLLVKHIHANIFQKFNKPEILKQVALLWIEGHSFTNLLEFINQNDTKMIWGSQLRNFKIDHIVDLCEGAFAYEGALVIGAIYEFISNSDEHEFGNVFGLLQFFQKALSYGLPTETAIAIYELGFPDRVISQNLAEQFPFTITRKRDLIEAFKQNEDLMRSIINIYPSYYQERMNHFI